MATKPSLSTSYEVLKSDVNRYALIGLIIAISSIILATALVSYQLTGSISLHGLYLAQTTNPAIWALDLTPLIFAYWGQSFLFSLSNKAADLLDSKELELKMKTTDLELKYQYEFNHDSLTQLPNRMMMLDKTEQSLIHSDENSPLAIIIIKFKDFEQLKMNVSIYNLNNILRQFSEKLKSVLLEPPILDTYIGMSLIAHLQNDEFAIMLPTINPNYKIDDIIEKITSLCSTDYLVDGVQFHINTIAGAAVYPTHGKNAEELLHNADVSLSNAQKQGLVYALFNPEMEREYTRHLTIMEEVKKAIENESINLVYQPYFHLNTRKIVGAEADLFIETENKEIINSDKIWPHIEDTTLGRDLTKLMLKLSLEQLSKWHRMGYQINLSVPLSTQEIVDKEIPVFIKELLARHGIQGEYLEIAFTEQACLNDQHHALKVLNELAKLEVTLSVVDFCSGYSSFVYLNHFPISKLKIDKTFIRNMLNSDKKLMLVTAMIQIAKTLQLQIQAMGIERKEVLEKLLALGCQFGKGSTTSLSAEDFEKLFNTDFVLEDEKDTPVVKYS